MDKNLTPPPDFIRDVDGETSYTEINEIIYHYCLLRDKELCLLCGKQGSELHHIKYRSAGGKHKPNNLATLCKKHHDAVHAGKYGKNISKILFRKIIINDRDLKRRLY